MDPTAFRFNLTGGEAMSFLGLLLTAAAIVWRGGSLSNRLSTIERDVAKLVNFQENATGFITGSTADRAALHSEVNELRRRIESIEATCRVYHSTSERT